METVIAQVSYPNASRTDFASRPDLKAFGFGEAMMGLLLLGLMFAFLGIALRPRRELEQLEEQALKFSHKRRNAGPKTLAILLLLTLPAFGLLIALTASSAFAAGTADKLPLAGQLLEKTYHPAPPPQCSVELKSVAGVYLCATNAEPHAIYVHRTHLLNTNTGELAPFDGVLLTIKKESVYGRRANELQLRGHDTTYRPSYIIAAPYSPGYFAVHFRVYRELQYALWAGDEPLAQIFPEYNPRKAIKKRKRPGANRAACQQEITLLL